MQKTFEVGQIFRFHSHDEGKTYYGTIKERVIKIVQKDAKSLIIQSNNEKELKTFLDEFFRVTDDYSSMIKHISIDPVMKSVIEIAEGLRLIQQEPFECSISYILSQNSNIPRIKHHLEQLALNFGKKIEFDNRTFYTFPSRDDLLKIPEETFRSFGFGYRAAYIYQFLHDYPNFLDSKSIDPIQDSEIFNLKLQKIHGIGQKVADCIHLFGYGDLNRFPTDVWIKRFMNRFYFHEFSENEKNEKSVRSGKSAKKITQRGQELFGKWAGYAQEFIYYAIRNNPHLLDST
ncbi:MAG: DNA-3-methyladenine glycosylase family protein [Promethearchaeota archaeon]